MAIYERDSGAHVAERVRPAPGSREAERYAALVADPASGWHCAESEREPEPEALERPAKSGSKADWVAFAVQSGMGAGAAEAMTRDQLAELHMEGGGPGASDN
ncbi:hypothetical protein [Streptomyces sp. NPDC001889]